MKRALFNDDWTFRKKVNPFAELGGPAAPYVEVAIPHDALIREPRDAEAEPAAAYFSGGTFQYKKTFMTDESVVLIEFEGVYRDAMVYINGHYAGQRPNGYAAFTVDASPFLQPGEENEVLVEARAHRDSRWYTGAGIYRNVWLHTGEDVHIQPHGLRVSTPDVERTGAVVEVVVDVANFSRRPQTVDVEVEVFAANSETAAKGSARVTIASGGTALSRQRLYVSDPDLWSDSSPALYTTNARITANTQAVDEASAVFGIRKLQLDPVHGLRINGEVVKLRGACVHHDNGILGAATFAYAEERRVRLLKEAGFNAIRSSHNPISSAMLDACDRLGVYVMDETFDVWTSAKSDFDYSLNFSEWWERDVESMIEKDFNHPSVILYSIGNEIPETGSAEGGMLGRALAEKVRQLDSTRYVTNAINGMLAVMDDMKKMATQQAGVAEPVRSETPHEGAGINTLMSGPGDFMNMIGASPLVTEKTAESFGILDVAGMNYLDARYAADNQIFPNRIIVGTETFPTRIDNNWALVQEYGHVIGDFTWTGWDYLGEVGIGRTQYLDDDNPKPSLSGPFPWIAAWCGDIDITGTRRPASYYREIVFGLRPEPYISVVRPCLDDKAPYMGPWTWSDSISSWTWPGHEGSTIAVEVYSDADHVELLLDGRSLGTASAGPANRFTAKFSVEYQPGELIAFALRQGSRAERMVLQTAGEVALISVEIDVPSESEGNDVMFVAIELQDAKGRLVSNSPREITATIDGNAELQALGSGNPAPETPYNTPRHTTFDGRALAVVRVPAGGQSTMKITSEGLPAVELNLNSTNEVALV